MDGRTQSLDIQIYMFVKSYFWTEFAHLMFQFLSAPPSFLGSPLLPIAPIPPKSPRSPHTSPESPLVVGSPSPPIPPWRSWSLWPVTGRKGRATAAAAREHPSLDQPIIGDCPQTQTKPNKNIKTKTKNIKTKAEEKEQPIFSDFTEPAKLGK